MHSSTDPENQPILPETQPLRGPAPIKVTSEEVTQEVYIQLLAERLAISYHKHKVGEVIIRKEIETEIIEVPIRREKLVVEQVSPEHRKLAEIDLGNDKIDSLELKDHQFRDSQSHSNLTIHGEISSPKMVAWLFDSIARQTQPGCKNIRIEIELENTSHYDLYQEWFDRCSINKEP